MKRLICQSTLGAGYSAGNLNFWWKHGMFGLLLRAVLADHNEQEALVRASGLDWTILRPAAFANGPRTGSYHVGFGTDAKGLTMKIARADVADALLKQVDDPALGRALALSY